MRRSVKEKMGIVIALTVFACAVMLPVPQKVYAAVSEFSDLPTTHWAYESIKKMQELGIVKGYQDGTFAPDKTVTNGEFIKMLVVAVTGEDNIARPQGSSNWASGYYKVAERENWTSGYTTDEGIEETQLNDQIIRGDMAMLAAATCKKKTSKRVEEVLDSISDVGYFEKDNVYHWDRNAYDIAYSYETGILSGYPDGSFRPKGTLTRAEACKVIDKILTFNAEYQIEVAEKEKAVFQELMNRTPDYVDENGTKWFSDTEKDYGGTWQKTTGGMYTWVKLSDYIELDDLDKKTWTVFKGHEDAYEKKLVDTYYFPEFVKFYKTPLNAEKKGFGILEYSNCLGVHFDEYGSEMYAIKGKKLYAEKEGILDSIFPWTGDMTFDLDLNDGPESFDYYIVISLNNDRFEVSSVEERTPRIYLNPFK